MEPGTASPAHGRRLRKWLGLVSGLAATLWYEFRIRARDALNWVVDKAFGDTAFEWLTSGARLMIGPDWYGWLWAHGPTVVLSVTALYLFLRKDKPATPPSPSPQGRVTGAAPPRTVRISPAAAPPLDPVALPEPDWGELYELSDEGKHVRLGFLPDTQEQQDDTLLLVVLGYKVMKGQDRVSVFAAHHETQRAIYDAPNSPISPILKPTLLVKRYTEIPDFGRGPVDNGLLARVGMAQGGFYELTAEGETRARMLAHDMIARR